MFTLIAAYDRYGGLGKNGSIPWHNSQDLRNFKTVTNGYCIIMGSKTFFSLPKILPNRKHVVLSSKNLMVDDPSVEVLSSVEQVVDKYSASDGFVIGGRQIYQQMIKYCNKMHITKIDGNYLCDVQFPFEQIDWVEWTIVKTEDIAGGIIFQLERY